MASDEADIAELRAEIARVARTPDAIERTLEVVSLIDSVSAPLGIHPVVVGGMAVYFWTATNEFATYDIDVVMEVPDELDRKLDELGFVRTPDGRHWTIEGTEVMLEAPSSRLDSDAVVAEVVLHSGRTARVVSRVDMLTDRLDEFQATGHETPARQALALLKGMSRPTKQPNSMSARLGAALTSFSERCVNLPTLWRPAVRRRTAANCMTSPVRRCGTSTIQRRHEDQDAHNRPVAPRSARTARQEREDSRRLQAITAREATRPRRGRVPAPHRHTRASYRATKTVAA